MAALADILRARKKREGIMIEVERTRLSACLSLLLGLFAAAPCRAEAVGAPETCVDPQLFLNELPAELMRHVATGQAALDQFELRRAEIVKNLEFARIADLRGVDLVSPSLRFCLIPSPTPESAIDPNRSLFVHDLATLRASAADFSLRRTLRQLASQVAPLVPGTSEVSIFRQLWDTQNAAPGVTTGPHCSDNGGTINGFPINCPRPEGREALGTPAQIDARLDEYEVLALVNRLDLAHEGWRNCGEHRIVYGKRGASFDRNLIIFEAVLPNPRPGCREGCLPVAEFWTSLSAIDDGAVRAQRLGEFFYSGLPGFRPVVHVDHYSATGVASSYGSSGSGQIRTNQFLQESGTLAPWLLKEFRTVLDCGASPCTFEIFPTSVKVNPHGPLWNEDNPDPLAAAFQATTLADKPRLASTSLMGIGYQVQPAHNAGQSMSLIAAGFVDNYREQMNASASSSFRSALASGSLTSDQMANRAIASSCAGCHQPRTFDLQLPNSIGAVTTPPGSPTPTIDRWPEVVGSGFVHVSANGATTRPELAANAAAFGTGQGHEISPALLDFFLPARKDFLIGQMNQSRCSCNRRFRFLPIDLRLRAIEISRSIDRGFAKQFDELKEMEVREQLELPAKGRRQSALTQRWQALAREREEALQAELKRAGIALRDGELLDLKPRPLQLALAVETTDSTRLRALKSDLLRRILAAEPPRRTVTGSFRSH